jgi:hypothetical protein
MTTAAPVESKRSASPSSRSSDDGSSSSSSSSSSSGAKAKPEPATFALGALVWAKMDAHCAWPAQVVHPQGDFAARAIRKRKQVADKHRNAFVVIVRPRLVADTRRGTTVVFFFGDHSFAWYPSAVRLFAFEPHFAQFSKGSKVSARPRRQSVSHNRGRVCLCVCAQSKSFQLALREASREKLRLEREGEHFGYRIIPDDDLSDTSSSSSSSSSSSLPDPPVAPVAAAVPGKRRRANTVSRGRRKKQTSVRAARQPRTAAADGKQAQSSSSSSSDDESSSSSSVPYTTLPDETDLSVLLPGKQSTLETAAARWAATRLQMASDANEWAVVLVLLARLSAMSATLDALRLSGVGKQVKRASKAPHAATASMATQLMGRWAALVRDTLKQSTDVISHTGTLKESSADAVVKDETAAAGAVELAPPPRTQEEQQEQGDEREHQQEQQSEKQ